MNAPKPESASDSLDAVVQSIDQVLDELADLAEQDVEPIEFYQSLLDRTVLVSESQAAALWTPGPNESVFASVHSQLERVFPDANHRRFRHESQQIQQQLSSESKSTTTAQPTPQSSRVGVPILMGEQAVCLLAIYGTTELGKCCSSNH